MTVDLEKDGKKLSFRDVRSYCPPCSLDTFLKSWEAPFSKSIFPYQRYSSVEELAQTTDFPTKDDFYNSLKQVRFEIFFLTNFKFLTDFNHKNSDRNGR